MVEIKLTKSEIETLKFYLDQVLVDVKGGYEIGIVREVTVNNLESIIEKISK